MKTLIFISTLFLSFVSFSQTKPTTPIDTTKQVQKTPNIVRGVDISNASPNQQEFITYMETLSDVEAFEILKTLVSGEIKYKKKD